MLDAKPASFISDPSTRAEPENHPRWQTVIDKRFINADHSEILLNANRHTAGRQLERRTVTGKKENSIEVIETSEEWSWQIHLRGNAKTPVRDVGQDPWFGFGSLGAVIFERDSFFAQPK